jgi:hypothetical protein
VASNLPKLQTSDTLIVGCPYGCRYPGCAGECAIEQPAPAVARQSVVCRAAHHIECKQHRWCTCRCHDLPAIESRQPAWWQVQRCEIQPDGSLAWILIAQIKDEQTALRFVTLQRYLTRMQKWGVKNGDIDNWRQPKPAEAETTGRVVGQLPT